METNLKITYYSLFFPLLSLELFYSFLFFATSKQLELVLVNIGGAIIALFFSFSLQRAMKKHPALRIVVREELWILIVVLALLSYGVFDPLRVSAINIVSLAGPAALLGALFLLTGLAASALFRIRRWEIIGIPSREITGLLSEVDRAVQGKEHDEVSWAYRNARYLAWLFVTAQLNLILVVISDILEKLIAESYIILDKPIPTDENGKTVGCPKQAAEIGLNLSLDNSEFDFKKFWIFRAKYIHDAIGKTHAIVPPEEDIEKCIKLLSKTLRKYPTIMSSMHGKNRAT